MLVHCFAGKSRSTSVVLAWLLQDQGMRLQDALALVQARRAGAQPNSGFLAQLASFERQLL